jgi:radical SAM protein with 4Fe4S-binding SPASM domain
MRTGPDYIQFYPTLRCNKSCVFCFNRELAVVRDMSLEDYGTMLEALAPAGVKTLDIIGGEPTLHPDIVRIVDRAVRRGLSVNISSNGTNLPLLAEIMRLGDAVTAGISVNDRDTFTQVRDFVQQHRPVVKMVFGPALDRDLIKAILALGPKRFYLIYRDAMEKSWLPEAVPFYQYVSSVDAEYDAALTGTVFCSGFLPHGEQHRELAQTRCPAGTTKIGIMSDGSVYPCNLFFGKKEFLLGNILTDPFRSIWDHKALNFFRSFVRNTCPRTDCALHARCHGGCPAHSFAHRGDPNAPDPRCLRG